MPYFERWGGMNLDREFVQVSKVSEDQKKDLHQKWNTFSRINSSGHLRSNTHLSQIIGGDADVNHTQTIWGDISPLPPRVLAPLSE